MQLLYRDTTDARRCYAVAERTCRLYVRLLVLSQLDSLLIRTDQLRAASGSKEADPLLRSAPRRVDVFLSHCMLSLPRALRGPFFKPHLPREQKTLLLVSQSFRFRFPEEYA